MNERTIIDLLSLRNSWWYNKKKFPIDRIYDFKRSDYYYLFGAHLEKREASVIIGPRGVGKSTVLLEIIRNLIGYPDKLKINEIPVTEPTEGSLDGRRILYASFEDPIFQKTPILELIQIYCKYILKEDFSQLPSKIHVFFDEIQNVPNWGDQIKVIQDLNYPIKFFITGSSSTCMIDESSKAARRVEVYSMHPVKFSDYLEYCISEEEFHKVILETKMQRARLVKSFKENKPEETYNLFLEIYTDLKPWEIKIQIAFEDYLIKGGYPGFFGIKDYLQCSSKLNQAFWLGFHKDLVRAKGIGDPAGMKMLTEYIANISSQESNFTSLMSKSKAGSNTEIIKKYLYHLDNAQLIKESNRFDAVISKRGHNFKIYMTDIAVRNMLTGMMNEFLLKEEHHMGLVLETVVFDHLLRFNFKFSDQPLFYWKDKSKNQEVDVVLDFKSFKIPVEVKKADSLSLADVQGLKLFTGKYNVPGIVTCGKKLALEENIIFLPHWLFLMIC